MYFVVKALWSIFDPELLFCAPFLGWMATMHFSDTQWSRFEFAFHGLYLILN